MYNKNYFFCTVAPETFPVMFIELPLVTTMPLPASKVMLPLMVVMPSRISFCCSGLSSEDQPNNQPKNDLLVLPLLFFLTTILLVVQSVSSIFGAVIQIFLKVESEALSVPIIVVLPAIFACNSVVWSGDF